MYQHGLKRVLDFLLALCGLLVLWPVFVIIAAAIKIDDPGPVFFSQKRVGLHKRYFRLYKFRSMKVSWGRWQSSVPGLLSGVRRI